MGIRQRYGLVIALLVVLGLASTPPVQAGPIITLPVAQRGRWCKSFGAARCGEIYVVGRFCNTLFNDWFDFCTLGLAADGVVASARFQPWSGLFTEVSQCIDFRGVSQTEAQLANGSGPNQFANLEVGPLFASYTGQPPGCCESALCIPLNSAGLSALCSDIRSGTSFVLGGSEPGPDAAGCAGPNDALFLASFDAPVQLTITFEAAAAPELDGTSSACPVFLVLGTLAVLERRRQLNPPNLSRSLG